MRKVFENVNWPGRVMFLFILAIFAVSFYKVMGYFIKIIS